MRYPFNTVLALCCFILPIFPWFGLLILPALLLNNGGLFFFVLQKQGIFRGITVFPISFRRILFFILNQLGMATCSKITIQIGWKYTGTYARAGIESKLLLRKPIFLTVFITSRCGLNLSGQLFYREELLKGNINKEMTLEEYDLFTSKSPPFPKLILTGGEPFLRDDLVDIAKCFYHNRSSSRQITIPTAGQHPDKIAELVKELLHDCPELILEIQLSIDGVRETHDEIRGKGHLIV